MNKLELKSNTELEINDVVTYDGESWIIVDTEPDFLWIRNVMDHTKTEKVKKEEVATTAGYGDTLTKAERMPTLSSVVFEDQMLVSNLSRDHKEYVEKTTQRLVGKVLRDINCEEFPSA